MKHMLFDSIVSCSRGKLCLPNGFGPFPTVIILRMYEEKDDPTLEFYARKMNEIGFLAFISLPEAQRDDLESYLNSVVDFLITVPEVNIQKIFLLMADRENSIDINMELLDDRIQAIASLNWLS